MRLSVYYLVAVMVAVVNAMFLMIPAYALANVLNVSMDPVAFGTLNVALNVGLTQAAKKWILPGLSGKSARWWSMGLGVVTTIVTGFASGANIGQAGQLLASGILNGTIASATFDSATLAVDILKALGIKSK